MGETEALADGDEILLRQVHPAFIREGRPSSQAWKPTKKDDGQLSVARGSIVDAKAAFEHHTAKLRLPSGGTWGVTVAECQLEELKAYPDPPARPPKPPPILPMR